MVPSQLGRQRHAVERRDDRDVPQPGGSRDVAHVGEAQPRAPRLVVEERVDPAVDVEALELVGAPVMRDEADRPLPGPGREAGGVEDTGITAVVDHAVGCLAAPDL